MPRSEQDLKGIRNLLTALLRNDTLGPPLLAKAAEVHPGKALANSRSARDTDIALPKAQRTYLQSTGFPCILDDTSVLVSFNISDTPQN